MKIITMSHDEHKHAFFCPACNYAHWLKTDGGGWTWNGDREKPTISPSILTLNVEPRCHSFVREGQIQFLDDCTHGLRGQTVPLPDFPGTDDKLTDYIAGMAPRTDMAEVALANRGSREQYILMRAHARALEIELRKR